MQRTYISIDLKSFYASVECRERGLDPLDTNLVVADERRTDKTICLAVTPSLKSYGIPGRGRLFEVKQRVQRINAVRRFAAPGRQLCGSSCSYAQLQAEPQLALDFIIAPPRMAYYMEYSTRIYEIYLRYVAPEDIIVYSVDEAKRNEKKSTRAYYDSELAFIAEITSVVEAWQWLVEKFGSEGEYQDVAGLCKIADKSEIAEKNYSLTPGAYVGVAPVADDGVDFGERMREIHGELLHLQKESNALMERIA